MTLYAFDAIDDSFEATRAFLWPPDLGRWAKLALLMFFVGGGSGFNPFQYNFGGTGGGGPTPPGGPGMPGAPEGFPSIGGPELAIIATVVGVVLLVVLVLAVIGSIMEFVFVESLRREAVTIRRYWGEHWGKGLRLFGFRLVLGVVTLAIVGGLLAAALAPLIFGTGDPSIPLIALAAIVAVVVAIVSGLVAGFTTVFVVPVMIAEGSGVLAGWRRFWPTVRGEWKQYAVYVVMGFVLQIAAGIVAGIATFLALLVVAIPFVILGLVGFGLLGTAAVAGWVVIGIAAALFLLAALVVTLFVAVPVQTFLRYYALFVLGDTNEDFDLIAERRAAVRADEVEPSGAAG